MRDTIQNKSRCLLICLLLALVTLAAFWQVKDLEFINFDDTSYVTENPSVLSGLTLQSITWAFTTLHESNWHPLTWLSHMLDCQLFGLNPAGHHLMNLFFHIVNTVLLFLVLKRMTNAPWKSAFVAALFALHPLHVESVAWVAERKDVLAALFWMLTMGAYAYYAERPGIGRYLYFLLFFILGLMSKPMLVTLPFVLLLLDYWPLGRLKPAMPIAAEAPAAGKNNPGRKKRKDAKVYDKHATMSCNNGTPDQWSLIYSLVKEKTPLFALSAISCVITFYAQQKGGSIGYSLPFDRRIGNALISYINYIGRMIWPRNMAIFYPYPAVQFLWHIFGAALILVVITILIIRSAKRSPYLLVGWFWFVGTLVPVIGLVQVGSQAMADRYTYIPFVGLFIVIAWGAPELLKKWQYRQVTLAVSTAIILVALAIATRMQLQYWRDSIALFNHALESTKNNDLAHYKLGVVLVKKGQLDEGISQLRKSIRLSPQQADARNHLGISLAMKGQFDEAIVQLREAIRLEPDYADAYYNLGVALVKKGQIDEGISQLRESIRLRPQHADAHNNLGIGLAMKGQFEEAISQLREAIRLEPDSTAAYNNLELLEAELNRRSTH